MRWALQWLLGWLFALWAIREAVLERRPPPPIAPTPSVEAWRAVPQEWLAPPTPSDLARLPTLLRVAPEQGIGCTPAPATTGSIEVRPLGPDLYEIAEWPDLWRVGRMVPHFRNGRAIGIKVFSLPPNIGLESGDVILSINGFTLTDPDKALEAYTKLKAASQFEIYLERDGRLLKKTYVLRPQREASRSRPSTSASDP